MEEELREILNKIGFELVIYNYYIFQYNGRKYFINTSNEQYLFSYQDTDEIIYISYYSERFINFIKYYFNKKMRLDKIEKILNDAT